MESKDENQAPRTETDEGQPTVPAEELVPDEEGKEATVASEVELLRQELSLLETQLHSMRDRYIRAVADLDNTRKRARQAIAEARAQGIAAVLLDLLLLADNFERALDTARPGPRAPAKIQATYDGILLIYRQLLGLLQRRGVAPIAAVGQPFDPTRHEAVAQVPATEDQKDGTVALEMQKGYLLGDQVLRPSKVGVAVHEPSKQEREENT